MGQNDHIQDTSLDELDAVMNGTGPVDIGDDITDEFEKNIIEKTFATERAGKPVEPVTQNETQQSPTKSNVDVGGSYQQISSIPSKFNFYKDIDLYARPMEVLEIKKLSAMGEDNGMYIVNDIIRKCTKGIDYGKILTADRLFIILWLRANSFRNKNFVTEFGCPKCDERGTHHFTEEDLDVIEFDSSKFNGGEIQLTSNTLVVKYMTINDEIINERFLVKNDEIDWDEDLLEMASMIDSVNGKTMSLMSKYQYITKLTAEDFAILNTKMSDMVFGVKPQITVKCEKCGGETPMSIGFRADFFIPKYIA